MDVLRRAEARAEEGGDHFIVASVASWGAVALLALPDDVAAREIRTRLDRLQPYWNNATAALLTLSVCVLRRVDDPVAASLHSFIWATPGAVTNAGVIAPELPEPEPSSTAPSTFDDALQLARAALDKVATGPDGASGQLGPLAG